MKNINYKKGFTLIELLVVVAIIGILASIVMGQLNSARARAANVAVKANLANLRSQANLIFTSATPNSYNGVCADVTFVNALTQVGIQGGTPAVCFDAQDTWVAAGTLISPEDTVTNWCVDSAGKSEGIDATAYATIVDATTLCP